MPTVSVRVDLCWFFNASDISSVDHFRHLLNHAFARVAVFKKASQNRSNSSPFLTAVTASNLDSSHSFNNMFVYLRIF